MKKLLVILSAVALVAAFSLPVLASSSCPTDPTQLQGQGQGQLSLQGQLQGQGQGQLQGQTQYSNDANFNSNGNCNTNKNSNTNSNFDAAVADAQTSACVDVNVNVPPIASACNDINLKQENCIDCASIGNATGGSGGNGASGKGIGTASDVGSSTAANCLSTTSAAAADISTVAAILPGAANGGNGGAATTNVNFSDYMNSVQVDGLFASTKANACIGANQVAMNPVAVVNNVGNTTK